MPTSFNRRLLGVLLAALLCGCSTPAAPMAGSTFSLPLLPQAASPDTPAAAAPFTPDTPAAASSTPATQPAAAPQGGVGGGGPSASPGAAGSTYLLTADGTRLHLSAGDAISLPAGLSGEVTLFAPGKVPATIALPANLASPLVMHPSSLTPSPPPGGHAVLHGQVQPAAANLAVEFHAQDGSVTSSGLTDATGAFSLEVDLDGPLDGVVVAHDLAFPPRLALAHTTVSPGEQTLAPLTLADASGTRALPAPPDGLANVFSSLELGLDNGQRVRLLTQRGAQLPQYNLPGFNLLAAMSAISDAGDQSSELSGVGEAPPDWLTPPNLAGDNRPPRPGDRISWGGASGATLYTVAIARADAATIPLWEGATLLHNIALPSGLALPGQDLLLRVDAWDAPDVSLYTVASLRRLRVPGELPGNTGRHSMALRRYPAP